MDELPEIPGLVRLADTEARHARQVIRLAVGDMVRLVSSSGQGALARITELSRSGVTLAVEKMEPVGNEPPIEVTLGLALLKADHMDWVVQKGTELGLSTFVPVITERTVVHLDAARAARRTDRWRQIARQAVKQCLRAQAPEVLTPIRFSEFLMNCHQYDLKIILYEAANPGNGLEWPELHKNNPPPRTIAALVGPEGGFDYKEVSLARQAGFMVVGIGPRILRAETAAIALLTIIGYLWGDLSKFS